MWSMAKQKSLISLGLSEFMSLKDVTVLQLSGDLDMEEYPPLSANKKSYNVFS